MDSKSQADKQMKLLVSGINDTLRSSLGLNAKDTLPWDENAGFRESWKPPAPPRSQRQAPQPARGTTATRPEGAGATAPSPGPAAPTPAAPAPAPAPQVTQEQAPAQTPASTRQNAPAAAQPDARLKLLEGRPPAYPGQQIRDKVTGITYEHNGTTWVPVQTGGGQ